MPAARLLEGVRVKTVLLALAVTVPTTPGESVKLEALIVAGFMGCEKVIKAVAFGQAEREPITGPSDTTAGATTALWFDEQQPAMSRIAKYPSMRPLVRLKTGVNMEAPTCRGLRKSFVETFCGRQVSRA